LKFFILFLTITKSGEIDPMVKSVGEFHAAIFCKNMLDWFSANRIEYPTFRPLKSWISEFPAPLGRKKQAFPGNLLPLALKPNFYRCENPQYNDWFWSLCVLFRKKWEELSFLGSFRVKAGKYCIGQE
jgi:hypothetical protein